MCSRLNFNNDVGQVAKHQPEIQPSPSINYPTQESLLQLWCVVNSIDYLSFIFGLSISLRDHSQCNNF